MIYHKDYIAGAIKDSAWFKELPDEAIQQLAARAFVKRYEADQFFYLVGEQQEYVCCVFNGFVRVSVTSSMGQEFVLTDQHAGSWMGEIALTNGASQVTEALIVEQSDLLLIPASLVRQVGEEHPGLYKNMFYDHMERSRMIYGVLAGMLFYPLKSRLAGRMLDLLEKHGKQGAEGIELDVHMSQLDFARMSMGSRQRVNKIFRDWVKDGLLLKQGDKYVFKDLESLRNEIEVEDVD